jgi:hypothetical protein
VRVDKRGASLPFHHNNPHNETQEESPASYCLLPTAYCLFPAFSYFLISPVSLLQNSKSNSSIGISTATANFLKACSMER